MPNGIGSRLDQGLKSQRSVCLSVTGKVIDLGIPLGLCCTVEFFTLSLSLSLALSLSVSGIGGSLAGGLKFSGACLSGMRSSMTARASGMPRHQTTRPAIAMRAETKCSSRPAHCGRVGQQAVHEAGQ